MYQTCFTTPAPAKPNRFVASTVFAVGLTCATPALSDAHIDLIEALRIEDVVTIVRAEGLQYAGVVGEDLLGDGGGAGWAEVVSRIYDVGKMSSVITDSLTSALEDQEIAKVTSFYTSDLGREIITLELAAREAMADEDVEQAANEAFDAAREEETWQYKEVITLIEDSDLIEASVVGALNSNLAYFRGLADGDALELSEDEVLAEVVSQQEEIRDEAEVWLGSFLLMAYQSLSSQQMDEYATVYLSDQWQTVNTAIIVAFDQMYGELNYLLGRAVADQLRGQDL